jgi:hypothetical protein
VIAVPCFHTNFFIHHPATVEVWGFTEAERSLIDPALYTDENELRTATVDAALAFNESLTNGFSGPVVEVVAAELTLAARVQSNDGGSLELLPVNTNSSDDAGFNALLDKAVDELLPTDIRQRNAACASNQPVDCQVDSTWSSPPDYGFGSCSETCGQGSATRARQVIFDECNGGLACPALSQTEECMSRVCECEKVICKFENSTCTTYANTWGNADLLYHHVDHYVHASGGALRAADNYTDYNGGYYNAAQNSGLGHGDQHGMQTSTDNHDPGVSMCGQEPTIRGKSTFVHSHSFLILLSFYSLPQQRGGSSVGPPLQAYHRRAVQMPLQRALYGHVQPVHG